MRTYIHHITLALIFMLLPLSATAQSETANYIRTRTMLDSSGSIYKTSIQYYDGKGRPSQLLADGTGADGLTYLRSFTEYDANGRVYRSSMPMTAGYSPGCLENYDLTQESQQTYGEDNAWTVSRYDALGRPISQMGAGYDWHDDERAVTYSYRVNAAGSVRIYEAPLGSTSLIQTGRFYAAGELTSELVRDEDGRSVETFTDRLGRKILERRGGDADTYFIYNCLGQLRFVLSPQYQADKRKALFAYEYRYDKRGRIVKKILPGCEFTQFWYDKSDRVQFMQDAVIRSRGLYRFTFYDKLGRIALQGTCTDCLRNTSANDVTYTQGNEGVCGTGYVTTRQGLAVNPSLEKACYYDNYDFLDAAVFSQCADIQALRSTAAQTDGSATLAPSVNLQNVHGLLTGTVEKTSAGQLVYTVLFYDGRGRLVRTNQVLADGKTVSTTSLLSFTGQPEKTLTSLTARGRTYTALAGNTYGTHTDRLVSSTLSCNGTARQTASLTYDALGRMTAVQRGAGIPPASYTYNIRGWIKGIQARGLEERLLYTYREIEDGNENYNGNVSNLFWRTPADSTEHGYLLYYDNMNRLTQARYYCGADSEGQEDRYSVPSVTYDLNGNILSLRRKGRQTDGEYGLIDDLSMSYDGNRLKSVSDAAAAVLTNGSADFKDGSASATEYSYNATGALTEDKNKGISAIEYDNFCCPRRITFTDGNATEYIYTQSGQKLAAIHRPHLISVWGDGAVKGDETDPQGANTLGFWDEGEDGLPVDTTEYLGCFVLRNGQVERILFNGGYVTLAAAGNGQEPAFHYYTFDHLGNVRAVYDEAGEIEQLITYDPFGAVIPDLSQNMGFQPYKYNGKELDRTFGLDWYDYGARNYDAAICRWDRVDPLCEKKPGISPYLYCLGNPIRYFDPNGMDEWEIDEEGRIINHIKTKFHDAFYMVDKEGQRLAGKSIEFKYGTVRHQTRSITKNKSYDVYKVQGDKNGTALFEFMADNTKVEWSQLKTGHEGTGTNFLTSSHEIDTDAGNTNFINGQLRHGYHLREINHNHPNNNIYPSGLLSSKGDVWYAREISQIFKNNPLLHIYLPESHEYIPYNQYSKKEDFEIYKSNRIDNIIVTP